METLMLTLTAIFSLGGLIMIGFLVNMIRTGDYSSLVGDGTKLDQASAQTASQFALNPTRARSRPQTARPMEQAPAVTGFAKETADFEDEVDRIQTGERFRAIRKRGLSK